MAVLGGVPREFIRYPARGRCKIELFKYVNAVADEFEGGA
jgi:hypothetical protein